MNGSEKASEEVLAFAWANLSARDRARVMADAPRTVWIFGAGASHHYNLNPAAVPLPLANDFFGAFQLLPTSQGFHAHVGPLISHLTHYRGIKPDSVPEWKENIEDFMTSIENDLNDIRRRKNSGGLGPEDRLKAFSLAAVFANMSFIFANVINEAQNGASDSAYRYLLQVCGPNDAFITFNWDTLLDRALIDSGGWTPNDGYGFSFSRALDSTWKQRVEASRDFDTNWKLLKLHGSTNWLVPYTFVNLETFDYVSTVPKSDDVFLYWQSSLPYATHKGRWRGGYAPTCYGYYPPNIPGDAFCKEHLSPEAGRMFVQGGLTGVFSPFEEPSCPGIPSSPLLITPVRQKRYDMYQSKVEKLWRQSADLMEAADKIVIVGYSFPPTDIRPMALLRDSLKRREGEISVEIVAPDAKDIVSRIGEPHISSAKTLTVHTLKFEEYLQVLWSNVPELMRNAALKNSDVKAWLDRIYAFQQVGMDGSTENA
jgi:hypothetical protein